MWKLSLIIFLISIKSYSQDSRISLPVVKSFYKTDKPGVIDSIYYANCFYYISLYGSFNDSCLLFINDTLVINKHIKTNESLGHTMTGISFLELQYNTPIKLTIVLVNRNIYLTENLDLSSTYRILAVYLDKSKWTLNYSNHIPILE